MNECEQFVCKNGGSCANINGSYSCQCTAGWTGPHCETGTVSIYYKICMIIFFEADHIFLKIECLFLLFATFLMHADKDECAEGRCQNNANCYNSDGSYVCICPNGWQGRDCEIGKTLHCNF